MARTFAKNATELNSETALSI